MFLLNLIFLLLVLIVCEVQNILTLEEFVLLPSGRRYAKSGKFKCSYNKCSTSLLLLPLQWTDTFSFLWVVCCGDVPCPLLFCVFIHIC